MSPLEPLELYNTLHNCRQVFQPQHPDKVSMYVCGPTVYGPVHVGNARPAVVFDTLYRLLKQRYPCVHYARNITDIDDKIIQAAADRGVSCSDWAKRWKNQYLTDMKALNVLPPDFEPLATEYIEAMITMIKTLLDKNFAYEKEGHVLFHVPAFQTYGSLSNRRREELIAGARIEVAPYKRDAADFVLWKPSTEDVIGWDSPWGRGRPGWHIECSAMAAACLGEEIDIHGGGQDLVFPHHENELAQSCAAHQRDTFAHYWLHNGHVRANDGEKMSKSLNNVFLLSEALSTYPGEVIRLALLSSHYRQPLNWSNLLLEEAKKTCDRWYRALEGEQIPSSINPIDTALADDLNTPAAITVLHQIANSILQNPTTKEAAVKRGELSAGGKLLGLLSHSKASWFCDDKRSTLASETIAKFIAQRNEARSKRDFATADVIRNQLLNQGIILEDTATETIWRTQ